MLLSYINKVPLEIKNILLSYIPKSILSLLSKNNFLEYFYNNQIDLDNKYKMFYPHYNGVSNKYKNYDSYLRFIIRNDFNFLFENILNIYYEKWNKTKRWNYKNIKFRNYLEYILYLCEINTSGKCKNIIKYKYKYN